MDAVLSQLLGSSLPDTTLVIKDKHGGLSQTENRTQTNAMLSGT